MGNDNQILNPVLIIISIGLIAYMVYFISIVSFGLTVRIIESVILIIAIIAVLVIITITMREDAKLKVKLNVIMEKMGVATNEEKKEAPGLPKKPVMKKNEKVLKKFLTRVARPAINAKEKQKESRHKKNMVREMLKKAESLADSNPNESGRIAEDAKRIYNMLSPEDRMLMSEEGMRINRLRKRLRKPLKNS